MALLKADVDRLNALATVLNDVGQQLDDIEIRSAVADIRAALPGCPIPDACATAGESTEYAWLKVADRFRGISQTIRYAANDFQTTDDSFAQRLDAMAFRDKGR